MAEEQTPENVQRILDDKRAAEKALAILYQDLRSFIWMGDPHSVYSNQAATMIASLSNTIAHLERFRDTLQRSRPS